jgi:tetratricopeptide (TPR) repeat protein
MEIILRLPTVQKSQYETVEITMTTKCTLNRSIFALAAVLAVELALPGSALAAEQKPEVQRLFQSGSYEQAVEAASDGDPASTFLAAQSLIKLDRTDRAAAEMTRLRSSDNPAWRLIGESGAALLASDAGRAMELARRAIEADGGNPFAQYQLGLSASKASDWGAADAAFSRTLELKPDFAYAHYYSALVHQRLRQLPKTAEHFDAFLRLAPDAPERSAVVAILRTIK